MKSIGFTYDFTQRIFAVTTILELLKSESLKLREIFFIRLNIEGGGYKALMGALFKLESEQRADVIRFEFGVSVRVFNTFFMVFQNFFRPHLMIIYFRPALLDESPTPDSN